MSVANPSSSIGAAPSDPFSTAHLMGDLKGRSVRGGAVTMAAQGAKFALQLGSTAVLARLLTPADFGLIAMVTAVTGFVAMFKDAGLSMATVQRESITHDQVSTLFWINVVLSIGLVAVTAALAPAIAWFYGDPRLTTITLALAATFVFGGLTVQHQALLQRQMRFTALSAIAVGTMAASVTAGIAAACCGLGYWSLVIMSAFGAVANAALVWTYSGWMPGPPGRSSGVMPMLKFGGNLTGFNFVNYFSRNADNVLIGWWWGADALGIYSKAYGLLMMPLRQLNAPITATAGPTLSRLNSEPARYRRAYEKMLLTISITTLPLVAILVASADLVVMLILGEAWQEAATIFVWLGLAAFVQPINNSLGILLISQGRSSDYFWAGVGNAVVVMFTFVLTISYGVRALAIGYAIVSILVTVPVCMWCGRKGHVRTRDIYKVASAPLAISVLGCCLIALLRAHIGENELLLQFAAIALGGIGMGAMLLGNATVRHLLFDLLSNLPIVCRIVKSRIPDE